MPLLKNRATEILAGYDMAITADTQLMYKWRHRLLAAYAQRRLAFDAETQTYRQRLHKVKWNALTGFAIMGSMAIVALLLLGISYLTESGETALQLLIIGGLLLLVSFLGSIVLAAVWLWYAEFKVPSPLKHPLKTKLFQPVFPQWQKGLVGTLPRIAQNDGAIGEHKFVNLLMKSLDGRYFILYSVQFKHGDDVDAIVVGPKGIWVFEVKYWSGKIICRNKQWKRFKTYHESGGQQVTKEKEVKQSPAMQWRRMADLTFNTLRIQAPMLVARRQTGFPIHGGIVFTNNNSEYDIDASCSAEWGDMRHWINRFSKAPAVPGWNDRLTMAILDALLKRHHHIQTGIKSYSMRAWAYQLMQQAESDLTKWANPNPKAKH